MTRWYFGLDPEAIREGHHPDFFRGQQAEFSVEATSSAWAVGPERPSERGVGPERPSERGVGPEPGRSAVRVEDCRYDLVAEVVAVDGWVLDCGILVHGVGPLPEAAAGSWITGRARLCVGLGPSGPQSGDLGPSGPQSGGRSASPLPLPGLVRPWYVERAFHRVEPVAEVTDPRLLMVDVEELGWEELAFTDAWHDDDGRAEYLLECVAVGSS